MEDIAKKLSGLETFILETTTFTFCLEEMFKACLCASLGKAFDFAKFSNNNLSPEHAVHCVGALRSTCESVIYLAFATSLNKQDRKAFIGALMEIDYTKTFDVQQDFFGLLRPYQRVPLTESKFNKMQSTLKHIWQQNGFPNQVKNVPPTEQIVNRLAERESAFFKILYGFLYRTTSAGVHFNPRVLLRSVWGDPVGKATYSEHHMADYHLVFTKVYSALLLCLYFELFAQLLNTDSKIEELVSELRFVLMKEVRWPEPVTFEEIQLNVPPNNDLGGAFIYGRTLELAEKVKKHGFIHTNWNGEN